MSVHYQREMTITHREFLRLLPKALNGLSYQKDENQILIKDGDGLICIKLSAESIRKIASLTLPMTFVHIELQGFAESAAQRFMSRFDLAYQKGGG